MKLAYKLNVMHLFEHEGYKGTRALLQQSLGLLEQHCHLNWISTQNPEANIT